MQKLSHQTRILIWFLVATVILCANMALIYSSYRQLEREERWVDHTHEVIRDLEGIISDLKDVQSAQRGYLITGSKEYLVPYETALPELEKHTTQLEKLVADSSEQTARLATLKNRIASRLATAANVIEVFDREGREAAFAMVRRGTGEGLMTEIRAGIAEMINYEEQLLSIRQHNVDAAAGVTIRFSLIGLVLFISLLAFVFWLIAQESRKREGIERSLQRALQSMRESSQDERTISEMSDYLQSCKTTEEAYTLIGKVLPKVLVETSGSIAVYNNSKNLIETKLTWGSAVAAESEFVPEECWGLRQGYPHISTPHGNSPTCSHIKVLPSGGAMCYPMQAHGEALGLFLAAPDGAAPLSEYQQKLIKRVGEQVSLAISNLKLQNRLRNQSIRDPMTGLYNRRYLEETMEQALSRAKRYEQPVTVFMLDIDHFKKFNDTMGHDAGDALLVKFAQVMQHNVRQEDVVCRYGGEEFIILLPNTSAQDAVTVAGKLCEATRRIKMSNGKQELPPVTVSIGIATYPQHSTTSADLISAADAALYAAKNGGRNQFKTADDLQEVGSSGGI